MKWSYQLINVEEVWKQNITGAGVHVRVNDDGVDSSHPEISPNFDLANSCEIHLPADPLVDLHGTACASIIGGAKNNGICAAGIAPDVTISACNNFATAEFQALQATTALFSVNIEVVDIISNSWGPTPCYSTLEKEERQSGPCPFSKEHPDNPCEACGGVNYDPTLDEECEKAVTKYCSKHYEWDPVLCGEYLDLYVSCQFHTLDPINEEGFPKVMAQGRGGKGPIIVFAGGNDYALGVDANQDGTYLHCVHVCYVCAEDVCDM
jgi:Subtilase family